MEQQCSVKWSNSDVYTYFKPIFEQVTQELGPPDVHFQTGLRTIKVHKKVLEKHSSVLKAKLSDVWRTSGDVFQLEEEYVEPEVVEELLTWLYFEYVGKPWLCSTENAYSLCVAAHYLLIPKLIKSCCCKLRQNITRENFYDLFRLSKHLSLDDLRQACEKSIVNKPSDFLLNPQVVKWKVEDLKMFIEKLLEADDSSKIRETVLSSLTIWTEGSFDDRSQDLDQLLKFVPPEALSSDALFRFMGTELHSKLDESRRKQYYLRSYPSTGVKSTDKLYCISREKTSKFHCLDLSTGVDWKYSSPRDFSIAPVIGTSWRENIYILECTEISSSRQIYLDTNLRFMNVFSTETKSLTCVEMKLLDPHHQHMLAGVALNDYIYITDSESPKMVGRSLNRFCLKTKQWEALHVMQTARLKHRLVVLDDLIYAIGGEVDRHVKADKSKQMCSRKQYSSYLPIPFQKMLRFVSAGKLFPKTHYHCTYCRPDQFPRPERYDPQTDRWEYIAPSIYHHELPAAVAREGQIYVLSQAGFETYSPKTDRWTRLPVPNACLRPSLVSIAGRLWLLTDSNHCPKVRLVYEFDVVKQEWTRLPDLPEGDYTEFGFVIKQ